MYKIISIVLQFAKMFKSGRIVLIHFLQCSNTQTGLIVYHTCILRFKESNPLTCQFRVVVNSSSERRRPVSLNPYTAKLNYLNFHRLEVVSRSRDPQLQAGENYTYLLNLDQTFTNQI